MIRAGTLNTGVLEHKATSQYGLPNEAVFFRLRQ